MLATKTSNKLEKHVNVNKNNRKTNDKFMGTGVYKLSCSSYDKFYIGQTGRSFRKRFTEHLPKPTNTQKSKFAEHLVNTGHDVNKIETNLKIVHNLKKSKHLTTLEQLEIYKSFKETPGDVLNDKLKYHRNIIFDRINSFNSTNQQTADRVQGHPSGVG